MTEDPKKIVAKQLAFRSTGKASKYIEHSLTQNINNIYKYIFNECYENAVLNCKDDAYFNTFQMNVTKMQFKKIKHYAY